MSSIDYLSTGTEIEVWTVEDSFEGFSAVKVDRIDLRDEDEDGEYAICLLVRPEGTSIYSTLHEKNFDGKETADAWRFRPPMSAIVSAIVDARIEIEDLRDEISEMRYSNEDDESLVGSDVVPFADWIREASVAALRLAIAAMASAWTYKAIFGVPAAANAP